MKQYEYVTQENRELLKEQSKSLLTFGRRFPSPGGSAYYLGEDGTPIITKPRETWITARMAHVYCLGEMLGFEKNAEIADAALRGLCGELRDQENGGFFAGIQADGKALPDKQCYAHAFVILAASSALAAGKAGAGDLLEEALKVFDRYFWNEEEGLASDLWDTSFTELSDYRGLNANMHTVEAFLAASDVTGDERYRKRAGRIISHVMEWMDRYDYMLPEHFSREWKPLPEYNKERPDDPFKPYGTTPGHAIEWARLILQWALTDKEAVDQYDTYLQAAGKLYNQAKNNAWDVDGAPGFCYTLGWDKKPVIHDRMHWVLAEAINTASFLYRLTDEPEYAQDYRTYMMYLDHTVIDHQHGSWYHQLDRNNEVIGTVWPGKPDLYHAFQAMIYPYQQHPQKSFAASIV
ncbi:MAG: AGE family epimerase/isomerase [Lachnospiraceae bacterium]|nr:AGE family epimerase/isomerase [Lachnospiraceae bacterium]